MTTETVRDRLRAVLKKHRWNAGEYWDPLCTCGWGSLDAQLPLDFFAHQVEFLMPIVIDHADDVAGFERDRISDAVDEAAMHLTVTGAIAEIRDALLKEVTS